MIISGDKEAGGYFYRARYYNPGTGRFLSEDPIGFRGQDANLYRYVNNNPVNFRDPSGTIWNFVIGGILGGLYTAITGGDPGEIIIATIVGAATSGASVAVQIVVDQIFNPSDLAPNDTVKPIRPSCNPKMQSCPKVQNPVDPLPGPKSLSNKCD